MKRGKSDYSTLEQKASTLKSVAHPVRLAILEFISTMKNPTVKNIYEHLEMQQSVISHHLAIMKKSNVLNRSVDQGKVIYSINRNNQFVNELIRTIIMK